jgi:hypothetical protein
MVTFLGSLSQFATTYTNLGSEAIGSLRGCQNVTWQCRRCLLSQARELAREAAE